MEKKAIGVFHSHENCLALTISSSLILDWSVIVILIRQILVRMHLPFLWHHSFLLSSFHDNKHLFLLLFMNELVPYFTLLYYLGSISIPNGRRNSRPSTQESSRNKNENLHLSSYVAQNSTMRLRNMANESGSLESHPLLTIPA